MCELGIYTDDLRVIERGNKSKVGASGCHIDVTPRLIGLRLKCETKSISAVDGVFTQIIDSFAQTFHRLVRTPARVRFHALAPSPKHENLRAKFGPQVHGSHSLLYCVGANS